MDDTGTVFIGYGKQNNFTYYSYNNKPYRLYEYNPDIIRVGNDKIYHNNEICISFNTKNDDRGACYSYQNIVLSDYDQTLVTNNNIMTSKSSNIIDLCCYTMKGSARSIIDQYDYINDRLFAIGIDRNENNHWIAYATGTHPDVLMHSSHNDIHSPWHYIKLNSDISLSSCCYGINIDTVSAIQYSAKIPVTFIAVGNRFINFKYMSSYKKGKYDTCHVSYSINYNVADLYKLITPYAYNISKNSYISVDNCYSTDNIIDTTFNPKIGYVNMDIVDTNLKILDCTITPNEQYIFIVAHDYNMENLNYGYDNLYAYITSDLINFKQYKIIDKIKNNVEYAGYCNIMLKYDRMILQVLSNLYYSNDGITWTKIEIELNDTNCSLYTAGGYIFCASSSLTNLIYYSNDGITWNTLTISDESKYIRYISYNNSNYIISRYDDILKSTDLNTWNSENYVIEDGSTKIDEIICYGNGVYLAESYKDNSIYSEDAVTWRTLNTNINLNTAFDTYNDMFISIGSTSYYSFDGIQWQKSQYPTISDIGKIKGLDGIFIVISKYAFLYFNSISSDYHYYLQFSGWDKEDFIITEDTVINGTWEYKRTDTDPIPSEYQIPDISNIDHYIYFINYSDGITELDDGLHSYNYNIRSLPMNRAYTFDKESSNYLTINIPDVELSPNTLKGDNYYYTLDGFISDDVVITNSNT